MGFFYKEPWPKRWDKSILPRKRWKPEKRSPYTAIVWFSAGLLCSNFLWNSIIMVKPFSGSPVPFGHYFTKGSIRLHLVGILGGVIWNLGMSFSIIASTKAGAALSYGLGQGSHHDRRLLGSIYLAGIQKTRPRAPTACSPPMFLFLYRRFGGAYFPK